jgi:hypothetical protein
VESVGNNEVGAHSPFSVLIIIRSVKNGLKRKGSARRRSPDPRVKIGHCSAIGS